MAAPVRDGSTPDRLLDEAEGLFARKGIQGVTTRELVEAAEQRNTSAVSYHFGSRDGLVRALLARRGAPIDAERGRLRAALDADPSVAELVGCLVDPWVATLSTPGGRAYVRIVDQLRGRFALWRTESDEVTASSLAGILTELEVVASGGRPVGAVERERVVGMIVLLTGMTADRARRLDDGDVVELDGTAFAATLAAMCAAVVIA